jgi:hypothetical protein
LLPFFFSEGLQLNKDHIITGEVVCHEICFFPEGHFAVILYSGDHSFHSIQYKLNPFVFFVPTSSAVEDFTLIVSDLSQDSILFSATITLPILS